MQNVPQPSFEGGEVQMKMKKGYYLVSYHFQSKNGFGFGSCTITKLMDSYPNSFLEYARDYIVEYEPGIFRDHIVIIAVSKLA